MSGRTPIRDVGSSRAATRELLGDLSRGGWSGHAWARFLCAASARSVEQARARPVALVQVSVLHLLVAAGSTPRGRVWAAASWALASSHLGLLEDRSGIGWANLLTLVRANLPALDVRAGAWLPVLAVLTDVADGAIARVADTVTPFGRHADFLADTALWTWFTLHHEPNRIVKAAVLIAWGLPVAAVAAASFARGRMIDVPRSRWWRPCASVQAAVCLRALVRGAVR